MKVRQESMMKRASGGKLWETVMVRPSKMPKAGLGLFAVKSFAKDALLPCPYTGTRLTQVQFERLRDYSYCMMLKRDPEHVAIDAKRTVSGNPLRYVNGACTPAQQRRVNVCTTIKRRDVWFKTLRTVAAGEEFVLDYGAEYWSCLRHNTRLSELKKKISQLKARLKGSSGGTKKRLKEELEGAQIDLEDFIDAEDEDP